jgi:hypothetical protein
MFTIEFTIFSLNFVNNPTWCEAAALIVVNLVMEEEGKDDHIIVIMNAIFNWI